MSAVPAPESSFDQGIPWHFGEPLREQRQLAAGTACVDISNRGVLTITGPDRLTWLHSLTTQHVLELSPGESSLALILSPHGHVEHELHLVDDGTTTWVIVQPGYLFELQSYLDSMRFMLRVEVADRSDDFAVIAIGSTDFVAHDSDHVWCAPEPFVSRGFTVCEVIVPRAALGERLGEYASQAGSWALEALRMAALMPRLGLDTDHRTIPNEMGWLINAVHLNKGCYRGQETVAKVNNLGQPPRRFVLLHLDGSTDELPVHGADVSIDGRVVGWVGAAAQHYELGPIATAVIKRSVPLDAEVEVVIGDATVRAHIEDGTSS